MSIIPAQMPIAGLRAVEQAPARRLPRAVGLGFTGLISAALWAGMITLVVRVF